MRVGHSSLRYGRGSTAEALDTDTAARGRGTVAVVLRVPDVDAAYADLADADRSGSSTHRMPGVGGCAAHVQDPDETLVEVNEPLQR